MLRSRKSVYRVKGKMESLEIMAFMFKKEKIWETVTNMEPFLNIYEQEGINFYRFVILLKIVFSNYSMIATFPKYLTVIFFIMGNLLILYMTPADAVPWIYISFIALLIHASPCSGREFEVHTLLLCTLAMNIKPYECLLDMYVLVCLSWYAYRAYDREFQKLSTVVTLMLSIGWYICNEENKHPFSLKDGAILLLLLTMVYFPLIPNPQTKHRRTLLYFYVLMVSWTSYKIYHYSNIENLYFASVIEDLSAAQGSDMRCPSTEYLAGNMTMKYTDKGNQFGNMVSFGPVRSEAKIRNTLP